METQESRAVSYADYYVEKLAQGRILEWAMPPLPLFGIVLPHPLRDVENLPRGGETDDVVKPFWKTLLLQNQLVKGLTNAYEVTNLGVKTPDIAFFQDHIDKPAAAEFVAYGDFVKARHGLEHQALSLDRQCSMLTVFLMQIR